ncbi:PPC domain-containing DNA-binding protein [Hymenobacter metallicola]|uniref:DNA-binding protein n=1 Tax=Hymenobacter metallicola TaxID=2563114 RepID=A0A4Z0QAP2_9BACT|nr:PPC domain-containing DNA-binding protein [Hymenobacter metallicola]TGE27090.1 DNA-binding protein [Hymenobacter metallicola]
MRIVLFLSLLWLSTSAALAQHPMAPVAPSALSSSMRSYALRLGPGQDLRQQLTAFTEAHQLKAAAIVTCVGSLTTTTLRLANQSGPTVYKGHFEIVSLVGTLSVNGSHLHLAVSDSTGRTLGGHLLDGNIIYTTAELVIGVLEELDFRRETDPVSTYKELRVYPAKKPARSGPRASPKKP